MGSKDGMDQMRKEEKRLRRELERRVELAGDENRVHKELPVYFVEQGEPAVSRRSCTTASSRRYSGGRGADAWFVDVGLCVWRSNSSYEQCCRSQLGIIQEYLDRRKRNRQCSSS